MKDIPFDMFTDRSAALVFHLTVNFYPRLPEEVVNKFVEAFKNYWAGNTDVEDLQAELFQKAGYKGSLTDCDFWQFLDAEDLPDDF